MRKTIERLQFTNIRNESDDVTADPAYMKIKITECNEQRHANKFNNLDEIDKYFARHILPKLTQ